MLSIEKHANYVAIVILRTKCSASYLHNFLKENYKIIGTGGRKLGDKWLHKEICWV